MTSTLSSSAVSHLPAMAVSPAGAFLLPASAGRHCMPGERRGGWGLRGHSAPTAITLGNSADKPMRDLSDQFEFAHGRMGGRVSNRNLNRKARWGSVLDVESPAALNSETVAGVAVVHATEGAGTDNRWLMGIRDVRGRDIASMDLDDPTEGPAALNLKLRKASGEAHVVVVRKELALLLDGKSHPHLASASSARRLSQVEDGRGAFPCAQKEFPSSEKEFPRRA